MPATVTAKVGPGLQATAQVINNVTEINFNQASQILRVIHDSNVPSEFDLFGVTTITMTITNHVLTLTVT